MRDAEAAGGLGASDLADPYAPYASPMQDVASPYEGGFGDPFNQSSQALPLVSNAARNDYEDDYDDHKSMRSEDFDQRTRLTSARDDMSQMGSESYAPSRNMFQNADHKALLDKEVLPGEIQENETAEVYKESSARRRWVALCWLLTWWVPSPLLVWIGGMKRLEIRQAWREKLALNIIIWFICGCAIFVIAILGLVICPTEHVYSTGELQSHSVTLNPNNVFTSIRGEVFDLTQIAQYHQIVVPVIPTKPVLQYGGVAADLLFPVQVAKFMALTRTRLAHYCLLGQRSLQRCQRLSQPVGHPRL
jgi:chitin synthase